MGQPILFLTGFEPFLDTPINPSGELARALHGSIVAGVEIRSCVLPVSFRCMPGAYAQALDALRASRLLALCSLGVQRESYFRLESRARPSLDSSKPDVDGVFASEIEPLGSGERRTTANLEALAQAMREAGAQDVRLSDDAGGYLCERCYWDVLGAAAQRGLPGIFLHVPPLAEASLEQQLGPVRAFIEQLLAQAARSGN